MSDESDSSEYLDIPSPGVAGQSETDYNFLEHQELPPSPPRHLQFEEEEEDQEEISDQADTKL